MGKLKGQQPDPKDVVANPADEGVSMLADGPSSTGETAFKDDPASIQGPLREGPDFGDESEVATAERSVVSNVTGDRVDIQAILDELPDEIADPFRQLRTAIADAKAEDWESAKRIHLVALVNDLRQLLRNEPKPETV